MPSTIEESSSHDGQKVQGVGAVAVIKQNQVNDGDDLLATVPVVAVHPVVRAPLVAIVTFSTAKPTTAVLHIHDGQRTWQQSLNTLATDHQAAIFGMYSSRLHTIRLSITDQDNKQQWYDGSLQFQTPALPDDFPPLSITASSPEQVQSGLRLFAVNQWINDISVIDYGYLIAVDATGEVVWYCQTGDRTADIRVLSNGHILYQHGSYRYLYEIDILGQDSRSWYAARTTDPPYAESIAVDTDTMHHELVELPSGNFLTLGTELRRFDSFTSNEFDESAPRGAAWVVCDEIIEFNPKSGQIVRRLPLADLLDTSKYGYLSTSRYWKDKYEDFITGPCYDWTHANSLQYLPDQQAVLVSLRHLDCTLLIDWQSSGIRWLFGDSTGWSPKYQAKFLKPVGQFNWPYHQHNVHFTESGTLLMFDNGNYRAAPHRRPVPAAENSSRVVAFRIDEATQTFQQVYSYGQEQGDCFYSPFYGQVQVLPQTNNLLVVDGGRIENQDGDFHDNVPGDRQWARLFEITPGENPHKVFEITCASPLGASLGWSIYRARFCADHFAGLKPKLAVSNKQPAIVPRPPIVKRNPLNFYQPKAMSNSFEASTP